MQGALCRLGSLRVTTSNSYYYKKVDRFGKDFKTDVLNAVKMESKRLESLTHPETPKALKQPCNPPPILTTTKTPETLQQPCNPPPILTTSKTPETLQQPDNPPSSL